MRVLFSSALVALAVAASLGSPAQASPVYAESSLSARGDLFSLKFGAGSSGTVIFDGYRTLDGRNFYVDDSSPSSRPTFSDAFSAVGGSNSQGFGNTSSNPGNNGTVIGFSGGREGFSFSSGGGNDSNFSGGKGSGSFSEVSFKGSSPLAFAFASLGDSRTGASGWGGGNMVASIAATPLPPTWTMMLIGLGCFGLIAHRLRKRTEKVFAA